MQETITRRKKTPWTVYVVYAVLIAYLIYTLYPIFLMVSTSLKSNQEIISNPVGFPSEITLTGYQKVFADNGFLIAFLNSVFVTAIALGISIITSIFLAYALARYTFKSAKPLYFFFLAGMMIPIRLGMLSLNDILYSLGLIDNLWGVIFIYSAMSIPFSMFILTGFIKMIPKTLDESAFLDGASELTILRKIIVPLIKPAIVTVVVYNFVPIWNDVYFPLVFLRSPEHQTLMLKVTMFFGQFQTDWNLVFSALTAACIPVLLIYLFGSKYLIRGLMAGSIKG